VAKEKVRGSSSELAVAALHLGGVGTVGIVDVRGHEAFVRTMIAGAAGVDVGLLVIAADDGVQPQTREHLSIFGLLGVRRGVVALTKCDLVDDPWLDLVRDEVRDLLVGTILADAPIIAVSGTRGSGLAELRSALAASVRQ